MSTPSANLAALNAARASVEAHPMCLHLRDKRPHFVVIYPAGDFPVDGLRVPRSAQGLGLALERMEETLDGEFPRIPQGGLTNANDLEVPVGECGEANSPDAVGRHPSLCGDSGLERCVLVVRSGR